MTDSILSLLRKVKRLADSGVAGERHVAQQKLAALLARHHLKVEDLIASTDRQEYSFPFTRQDELDVLLHCYNVVRPSPGTTIQFKRSQHRKLVWFDLTPLELADLRLLWKHHRTHYRAERKKFLARFEHGYLMTNDLAASGGEPRELTKEELDELLAILALSSGITKKPWIKARALITP